MFTFDEDASVSWGPARAVQRQPLHTEEREFAIFKDKFLTKRQFNPIMFNKTVMTDDFAGLTSIKDMAHKADTDLHHLFMRQAKMCLGPTILGISLRYSPMDGPKDIHFATKRRYGFDTRFGYSNKLSYRSVDPNRT